MHCLTALQVVTTQCLDGTIALRALCTSQHLGRALPLKRDPETGEPIQCLELTLDKGQVTLENLSIGDVLDFAALQCQDGELGLPALCTHSM